MVWKKLLIALVHIFISVIAFGQTVNIQNFTSTSYAAGGGITTAIKVDGCFGLSNKFEMYLSDASGNFAGGEVLIGSFNGFFAPFINGVIPASTTPGSNYKLRIVSTQPATSVETVAFTITSTIANPVANLLSSASNTINDSTYGRCLVFGPTPITLQATVPAGYSMSAQLSDSAGGNVGLTLFPTQIQFVMQPNNWYVLKVQLKNNSDNTVSTKSFLVIVSANNLSLQTSGASDACLPDTKVYTVNVTGNGGIRFNYPGTKYTIEWGDGSIDTYTQCALIESNGEMRHDYVNTSCGRPPITDLNPVQYNAFRVNVQASNVYCPNGFTSITTYAKVWQKPIAKFINPMFGCINVPITFENTSEAGLSGYNNVVNCIDVAVYEWYVDGQLIFDAGKDLVYTFTTPGYHHIRLVALNDPCSDDFEEDICIEEPILPNFKVNGLDSISGCAPLSVTINNNTQLPTNPCRPLHWRWQVLLRPSGTPATEGVDYTISPNDSANNPTFQFLVPGEYYIRLSTGNSCGIAYKDVPVTITDIANVTFQTSSVDYCGTRTIDFSQPPHRPNYSSNTGFETYQWTITGGSYSFVGGTNANSPFPQIKFDDTATYTIHLQFVNACGVRNATQNISFEAPVFATAMNDTTVCFSQTSIQLSATTTGAVTSGVWSIVDGSGSLSNNSIPNPVYTFNASDKASGMVKLVYTATGGGGACGPARDTVVITILAENKIITSADTTICSGQPINYIPATGLAGSLFTWTSTVVSGSVTGNTASGSGAITDILTNTSSATNAVVKYTITPTGNGCSGTTFVFTATVVPLPDINLSVSDDTLCTGETLNITMSSSYIGALYTWKTTVISGTVTGASGQTTPTSQNPILHTLVNTGNTAAVITYTVQVHANGSDCEGETKTITIVVEPAATAANAGADQLLCNQAATTLAASQPLVGTGKWTLISGPAVVITDATLYNTSVTGLQPNTIYSFEWKITGAAGCPSSADTVTITNRPAITPANAGGDKLFCDFDGVSGSITLTANAPAYAVQTGTWSLIQPVPFNSNPVIADINNPASQFSFDKAGVYKLVWTITGDGDCTPNTDTMVVRVFDAPYAGAITPPVSNICIGENVSLAVAPVTGTVVKWQYNKAPFSDNNWIDTLVTNTFIDFNNIQDSMLVRVIVRSDGFGFGCTATDTSELALINVAPKSVGGNTNADATVCYNNNSGTVTLTNYVGAVVRWETSTNSGLTWVTVANTQPTIDYGNLVATTWYRAIVQSGSCFPAISDTTIITVVPAVSLALAGNDQLICDTSVALQANSPAAGETGNWTQVSGPSAAVLSSTTSNNTTASALLPGVYAFAWHISNNVCAPSADTVLITVRPAVTPADAGGNQIVCDLISTTSIVLNGNINTSRPFESGSWNIISQPVNGNGSFSNDKDPVAVFSLSAAGTYQLVWTLSNDAGCAPTKDTVTITAYEKPVAGNLTGNTNLCAGGDVAITLNSFTGTIRKWQYNTRPLSDNIWIDTAVTSATINFLSVSDTFAVRVIVQSAGFAAGCTSTDTSNILVVNVMPNTNPGTTGPGAVVCANANGGTITLSGNVGTIVRWETSTNGGASWTAVNNTTSTYSYTNLPTTTFVRAIVESGSCGNVASSITIITVVPQVTPANAGADVITCNDNAFLTANTPGAGETGRWTQVSGPTNASLSSTTSPSISVSNLLEGNYQFMWTIDNGGCAPTTDTVMVTVRPAITTANAGVDTVLCSFSTTANITLHGSFDPTRSFEVKHWNIISQPANGNGTFSDENDPAAIFTFNAAGVYTLSYAITNDGGCSPSSDTVSIHVFEKPVAGPIAGPTNICAGNDVIVSMTNYTGNIQKWQYNPAPVNDNIWIDTAVANPNISFINVRDTIAIRAIVQSAGVSMGCVGTDTSNMLVVAVTPAAVAGTTAANDTVCNGMNGGTITLTGNVGNVVRWESSGDNGNTWAPIINTNNLIQYNNLTSTTWFRAIIQSGSCGTVPSTITVITVIDSISAPNAGADQVLCNEAQTVLSGNSVLFGETATWSQLSGPAASLTATNTPTITVTGLQPGTYTFLYSITNGICPSRTDTIIVVNHPPIVNLIDTAAKTICFGSAISVAGQLPTGGNGTYTYQWQQSTNGTNWVNISAQTNQSLSMIPAGSVYVRRLVTSLPCNSISEMAYIKVQPPVDNNTIAANQNICTNTIPAALTGSLPTGATGVYNYQWQESTDGGQSWLNIPGATGQHYQPIALTVTTLFRRNVSSGYCIASQSNVSDSVIINVNPDAKADFTFLKDTSCPVFVLDSSNISNQHFAAGNGGYYWYANNSLIGTTQAFPGYSIQNSGDSVVIKLIAISSFGCKNDTMQHTFYAKLKPTPSFTVSDSVGCGPLTVNFTNTTPNPTVFQYKWNFGNGQTLNAFNPGSVVFMPNPTSADTVYTVALTVYSECDSITVFQNIRVKAKPRALFSPDKTVGCSPLTVTFRNTSKGSTDFTWDFGDGSAVLNTPSTNDVKHTFTTTVRDTFVVQLVARNSCGIDTQRFSIIVSPNDIGLYITVNGTDAAGCAPHAVTFFNNSVGASSFVWNFGDGNSQTTYSATDTIVHVFDQPGVYNVQVRASNGCADTVTYRSITVHGVPKVDFTATPNVVCIGEVVRFNNLSDTITNAVWRFGDGITSALNNPTHAYTAAGNYTIKLIGSRQYNSGNICVDSATKTVQVIGSRPGAFGVSDSISRCVPFTVTFTNQSLPSSLTVWDFGNGKKDTGNVVTHTFTATGNYNVVMNAQSPGGCKYQAARNIIVNGPSGTMTYDTGVICGLVPVRFETNTNGVDSVKWTFGDGTSLTTTAPVIYHTYQQTGSYVPSVMFMANNATCRSILPGADTIKVERIKAGFKSAMIKQCGETKLVFTDTSKAYFGISNWSWNFGDGGRATIQHPTHAYSTANNWPVTLIAKSAAGCTDTASMVINVPVANQPRAFITADTIACVNQGVNYTSSVVSNDSISLYLWTFSNGASASIANPSTSYGTPGMHKATLVVSTVNGCMDTTIRNIFINPSPLVKATDDVTLCKGQVVQLNVTGAATYSWTPSTTLSCATCTNPIATPAVTTVYTVTGTNLVGCYARDTVRVNIAQPFKMQISTNDTICTGERVQLSVTGAEVYKWAPAASLDNPNIADPIASPTATTVYRVVGYDSANCFTDTAFTKITVGKNPTVDLGPDKVVAAGTLVELKSVVTNGPIVKWEWKAGPDITCTNCPQPTAQIKRDITYTLKVTNTLNCVASDSINFKVFCEQSQVYIPNVFTPDGDGFNDVLMVRGQGIRTVKMFRIFNRWGEIVFEKVNFAPNEKANGWDGTVRGVKAPADVYVYMCEVTCENDIPFTYKGNVAIIK